MKRLLVVLIFLGSPGVGYAEDLGRLFFTPEQRAALDARRKARVPDRPNVTTTVSPTTRLDGYVKRQGGRSTVFVNGDAVPSSTASPLTNTVERPPERFT